MSKGSKPRPTDKDAFSNNYDKIFNKGKKEPKLEDGESQKLPWAWAKDALKRQEAIERKKKR